MDDSTFADRLWWARHKAGLGATRLARLAHCSQSLISGLERNNADKSKFATKFANILKVDPSWLAVGTPARAPSDFDPEVARKGRESQGDDDARSIVRLPTTRPQWATSEPEGDGLETLSSADAMMDSLMALFLKFARLAGAERAMKLLDALRQLVPLLSSEEVGRKKDIGSNSQ